jgi:predicted kinase
MSGVPLLQHLGPDGYSSQVSERVSATLAERAAVTVREGHSAVVDAVYARASDRQAIEEVATAASVPFIGLWLDAPEPVLIARAERRRNDPSDADAPVIRMQREKAQVQSGGAGSTHRCRRHPCCLAPLTVCERRAGH